MASYLDDYLGNENEYPGYRLKFLAPSGDYQVIFYAVPIAVEGDTEWGWAIRDLIAGMEAQGWQFALGAEATNRITWDAIGEEEVFTSFPDMRPLTGPDPKLP